ncbi:phage head completion protein [Enterococcus avium]|uniref:phage head completion protein n=1 Tax=Enterococcus avium TaxID=33945 RepID=UPI002890D83D|nr:head-tail adaptor protein [Enterococcus avium]MDT2485051.1 head-tail adaptor protein [Enterococcus avium]MDT2511637.1 head-tail adaptor protein [Enterococcus avium]
MFAPQSFIIQEIVGQKPDGIGGLIDDWRLFKVVNGYLDLLTGTDENALQNASVEDSTHILVIPDYTEGIADDMRVVDSSKRWYAVTYSDDPAGVHHHNELYLKFGGVLDE